MSAALLKGERSASEEEDLGPTDFIADDGEITKEQGCIPTADEILDSIK